MNTKYKCDCCGYRMTKKEMKQWKDCVCPACFPGLMVDVTGFNCFAKWFAITSAYWLIRFSSWV